jgi:hypothetical protein
VDGGEGAGGESEWEDRAEVEGEGNEEQDWSWDWAWALDGETPPPSAIVSRRDTVSSTPNSWPPGESGADAVRLKPESSP